MTGIDGFTQTYLKTSCCQKTIANGNPRVISVSFAKKTCHDRKPKVTKIKTGYQIPFSKHRETTTPHESTPQ